jgi:hypothetical protein
MSNETILAIVIISQISILTIFSLIIKKYLK